MSGFEMKKAFTLVETLVAVGILAVMVSFSGVVFKAGIDSTRVADANAEIMRNLRAITDQLDSDFRGVRKEVSGLPMKIGSEQSMIDGVPKTVNSDRIVFFANGDFQSIRQYDGKTVRGNVAAIYYGLIAPSSYPTMPGKPPKPQEKILARRQTILTADNKLPVTSWNPPGEYYVGSLSQVQADTRTDPNTINAPLIKRPRIMDIANLQSADLAVYMARGVDDFTIEYSEGGLLWHRPRVDNMSISPVAFKFSFRLYDSKGIIKNGRMFSYIVYVGD